MSFIRSRFNLLVAGLILFALTPTIAPAQSSGSELQGIRQELQGLRETVDRLGAELADLVRLQKVQLLFQRIAVEEARLAPLNDDLRRARAELRGQGENLKQMKSEKERMEELVSDAVRDGNEEAAEGIRNQAEEYQRYTDLLEEQTAEAERRIMELENDLGRARRQINILDEKLTEALEQLEP